MSALAFVRGGDGVLVCVRGNGAEPVLGALDARGSVQSQRVAVLGALECGEQRRGSVRCGDGVQAGPGGCAKGAEPAYSSARPRAAF